METELQRSQRSQLSKVKKLTQCLRIVFQARIWRWSPFPAVSILVLLEIIQHSTGLIFFSLIYSLKWLSSDFTEGIQKYDCMCNEFSKDYTRILKYTKMNCRRNVADKFDMSPEDSEKKVKDIRLFFSAITAIIWKPVDRWNRSGSQGSLNQFFSDSGDPSDYMEPDLKNSGESTPNFSSPVIKWKKKSSF